MRACGCIDKDNTTIIDSAGKKKDIEARVAQIKAQIEETSSDYDREKLQERLAKLMGSGHYQGRRRHRGRGQGAPGPGRGCHACDQGRGRGGRRRRWRRGRCSTPAACSRASAATPRPAGRHRDRAPRCRRCCARSPRTPASTAPWSPAGCSTRRTSISASMPRRPSTST